MKKLFVIIVAIFLTVFNSFAASNRIADVVLEISCEADDLPDSESGWLPMKCKTALESNLNAYFTISNQADAQYINDNARGFVTSEAYNEEQKDRIDGGHWITPTHTVLLNLSKSSNKYKLNITVTELRTKREVGASLLVSDANIQPHDLYSKPGCLINKSTIEICEMFKVPIIDKNIILYGEDYYSNEDLLKKAEMQIKKNQESLENLKIQRLKLKDSTKTDDVRKRIEIDSQITLEQAALEQAEDLRKRAEMALELEEKEAQIAETRNEKLNNRINYSNNQMKNWEKYNQTNIAKMEEDYVFSDIDILESMKASLFDIKNNLSKDIISVQLEASEQMKAAKDELNKPLRTAEKGRNGNISDEAKRLRESKYYNTRDSILQTAESKISEYNELATTHMAKIRQDIDNYVDNVFNKNIRTLQTLTDSEFIVTFGRYDAPKKSWPLHITIKSSNQIIFNADSNLPYSLVSGKDANRISSSEYEEDVQFYQNIFSQGASQYTFALDYRVVPASIHSPSTYNFTFFNFRVYDTKKFEFINNKINFSKTPILAKLNFDSTTVSVQFKPTYDIRTKEEIVRLEEQKREEKKQYDRQQEEKRLAIKREQEKIEKKKLAKKDSRTIITLAPGIGTACTYPSIGSEFESNAGLGNIKISGYYGLFSRLYVGSSMKLYFGKFGFTHLAELGFNTRRSKKDNVVQFSFGFTGGYTVVSPGVKDFSESSENDKDKSSSNNYRSTTKDEVSATTVTGCNEWRIRPVVGITCGIEFKVGKSWWISGTADFSMWQGALDGSFNVGVAYVFFQ